MRLKRAPFPVNPASLGGRDNGVVGDPLVGDGERGPGLGDVVAAEDQQASATNRTLSPAMANSHFCTRQYDCEP